MSEDTHDKPSKRRLEKKRGPVVVVTLVIAILLSAGAVFLYLNRDSLQSDLASQQEQGVESLGEPLDISATEQRDQSLDLDQAEPDEADDIADESSTDDQTETDQQGTDLTSSTATSDPFTGTVDCQTMTEPIVRFFGSLDRRPYMLEFDLPEPSRVYFPALIQRLLDNPPVVSGETDDLFTILQNTAHFFRIIGKKNIFVLKGILDREKATFEQTLERFYLLTKYPDCLQEQLDLSIEPDPLYHYAGFFLNTMGGRLYLFRRDSMSRMIVSYYAILTIDQANREGRNTYGIELNGPIDTLIDEIESSSIKLQLRDTYLDTLYQLKERYQ